MWYTAFPTMNGPATDHFRRSDEWKRNPPFFVPTATTTLPFLIVRGMSPTCDAGKDVNGVSGFELCLREGTHDDFLVDEDIHVRPPSACLVPDPVPTINVPAKDVRRALFGVDVDAADLVIAKERGYDLVIAHHPTGGSAVLEFPKVLTKHADILTRHGVPHEVAASAVREMQEDREPRAHAENYDRLPSIARLLGIGLMCIHNPCDAICRRVMDETF